MSEFEYQAFLARRATAASTHPPQPGSPTGPSPARERALHEAILTECRARGWLPIHSRLDKPATTPVGSPDFVVVMPGGRVVFIECKTAKGKLSREQQNWLAWLRSLGHQAEVVRSLQEFLDHVGRQGI